MICQPRDITRLHATLLPPILQFCSVCRVETEPGSCPVSGSVIFPAGLIAPGSWSAYLATEDCPAPYEVKAKDATPFRIVSGSSQQYEVIEERPPQVPAPALRPPTPRPTARPTRRPSNQTSDGTSHPTPKTTPIGTAYATPNQKRCQVSRHAMVWWHTQLRCNVRSSCQARYTNYRY